MEFCFNTKTAKNNHNVVNNHKNICFKDLLIYIPNIHLKDFKIQYKKERSLQSSSNNNKFAS